MDNLIISNYCQVESIDGSNSANGSNIIYLYDRAPDSKEKQILFEYCDPDMDAEYKSVVFALKWLVRMAYHYGGPIVINKQTVINYKSIKYINRPDNDHIVKIGCHDHQYHFFWSSHSTDDTNIQALCQGIEYIICSIRGTL